MSLSRFFTFLFIGVLIAGSSFAATVYVPGSAPTINGALELLDYQDGVDDIVIISPGIYDEQVAPKANAGNDASAFPTSGGLSVANMQAAIQSHTDRLTLRGSDPNDPPVIRIDAATPAPYGVFPGNPGDFFFSTFVYLGHDITMQNVELRSNTADYAKNGMASNFVWQDCVLSNGSGDGGPGEDFCDYNNNLDNLSTNDPLIGLDNEYVYSNCIIDGSDVLDGNGARFGSSFVWWHGYGSSAPAGNAVGSGVAFDNCVVRYWDDIIHQFRAPSLGGTSGAPNGLLCQDCFFYSTGDIFNIDGSFADTTIIRNVVDGGDAPGRLFRNGTREGTARGAISHTVCANNLLVGLKGCTGYRHHPW